MLCQKCQKEEAAVHLALGRELEVEHFCEQCASEFCLSLCDPLDKAQLRWQLYGTTTKGFVHVRARVEKIEDEMIVVRVINSSVYPANHKLIIQRSVLSGKEWSVGEELSFTNASEESLSE